MSVQQLITSIPPKEDTMKIKLLTALTTVALFALPIAEASANHSW
jgi:hypothetical protein